MCRLRTRRPTSQFATLPDPGPATTLDDVAECLRRLKAWAGNPSYETITGRVNAARPAGDAVGKTTVVDCFRAGRRRIDVDLVVAVVEALHADLGYATQWRQALRVVTGEAEAAGQVRVQDSLPQDPPGFTGRAAELEKLRAEAAKGGAVVISALAGMAGVGKTQLAVHVGHLLAEAEPFDRVLFVNLRGFHPDRSQPPADPAAVLDGFLRLLGVPGQAVPHELAARSAAFRLRLAGSRSLVVLDNAADEQQVAPLLPGTPGCVTLVTSRRDLAALPAASHFAVDVFTPAEAVEFLGRAVPGVPAGTDPAAAARIAVRCGHLPLALALIAGHMRAKPGWTLTDHADWLDERHAGGRLDSGVELALDVSYRNLPDGERELLRLLAQHPGQDLDVYAAAALAGTDLATTRARVAELAADHLLQPAGPDRWTLHDLIRAYASSRSADEDRRADRDAALTRLFDYYLVAASAAMNTLDPVDKSRRPAVPEAVSPLPDLSEPLVWLDAERPNLIATAAYTATHGRATHTTRLAAILFRYLAGGHHNDALAVHGHAARAAQESGDTSGHARAVAHQAVAEVQLGLHSAAADHLEQAHRLFQQAGDEVAAGRTRNNLGIALSRLGRYREASEHHREALRMYRKHDDTAGAARALTNLGNLELRLGRVESAARDHEEAIGLYRTAGDRVGEGGALTNLAEVEVKLTRYPEAAGHLDVAIEILEQLHNRSGVAWALDVLGSLHRLQGDPATAAEIHRRSLEIFRQTGDRDGEACVRNGLGEDALAAGDPARAVAEHTAALALATEVDDKEQRARAYTGRADAGGARGDYERALAIWQELGSPQADRTAELLTKLD